MFFNKKVIKKANQKGFSIIEILVVLALLTIILYVSLFNYDRFGKETELENSVYSVALAIRETQTFGINKKAREGLSDPQDFGEDYGYGVHFRTNLLEGIQSLDNKNFALFVDSNNGDKIMTGNCSPSQECYSVISLGQGNYISNIKVQGTGSWIDVNEVNIYFKRPNPDSNIISGTQNYSRAKIIIKDPTSSYSRCVDVGVAGDITIKNDGC